jgi:hypothetical protein
MGLQLADGAVQGVQVWAWDRNAKELVDRSDSPWNDPERRPSHANRRKTLRAQIMQRELSTIAANWSLPKKFLRIAQNLVSLAA